ncbi:MAG: hypothetical protein ACTJH7_00715 [Alcaligenes sp.]
MKPLLALLLMTLLMLSPVPAKTQGLSEPIKDPQISWDQGQITQTDVGPVHSWALRTELDPQALSSRLEPFCGASFGAMRLEEQWVFLSAKDSKNCVLWLDSVQAQPRAGLLSMAEQSQRMNPSLTLAEAPVPGPVLWQHEQPGEAQSWLLVAESGWQEALRRKAWGSEAGERFWRRGPAELDVMELEYGQERYLLLICRACEKEAS